MSPLFVDDPDYVTGGHDGDENRPVTKITYKRANDVEPTKPDWLWQRWVLLRALNLLAGRQGSGKTTFVSHLVAMFTQGAPLPGDGAHEPINVAWLSLEEPDDRVRARLDAAGADIDRVIILGDVQDVDDEGRVYMRRWTLPKDITVLGELIKAEDIRLVVIDGLGYSINGDSHNYAVVGSALSALAGEAERTGAAVLGLVHPPKGASDPVTAAIGSTAWTAIPRISMVLGVDPDDETRARRVVRVAKSNYAEPENGLSFTIGNDPTYECGFVQGLQASAVTAEHLMATPTNEAEKGERSEACDFLRQMLADESLDARVITNEAKAIGISETTLKRARRDLGVISTPSHDGRGKLTGWKLSLPSASSPVVHPVGPLQNGDPLDPLDTRSTFTRVSSPEDHEFKAGPLDLFQGGER